MRGTAATRHDAMAVDRPDDVRRVRDALDRAGFDERPIRERIGLPESADMTFSAQDRPRVLRRTREGDALATFVRVFLADVAVPLEDFRRAVEPMDPAVWAELGLVAADGDLVRRRVALRPSQGLVIASDFALPDGSTRTDHVLGVSGTTKTFARVMMPVPAEHTLDLGTGGGYLGLRAAAHSRHVLGTDVNARAIAMARVNAQLNGVDHIDLAVGDLYEPAGERRFDLILSNPPFVVSPGDGVMFRDSGLLGDEICERIIRGAPAHLAEGGFAQVLCNWVRLADRNWVERLTGWFEDSGCDVWVIQGLSFDPGDYAQHWLGQTDAPVKARYAEHFDRWMDYYDRQGIEAIDVGLINLRRRAAGRNWVQFDVDRQDNQPNGMGIYVGFAARDLVRRLADLPSWLSLRLRCRPELRLAQRLEPGASGWKVEKAECILGDGLQFEGEVDPVVFHLLTLCRGRETLAEILPQVAARVGRDPEEVLPAGLRAARELVEQGFLWPADLPLEPPGLTRPGTRDGDGHAGG